MKHITMKLLAAISMLLLSFTASAYDFEVDGIYYDIMSIPNLTATASSLSEDAGLNVVIPSTVEYKEKILSVISVGNEFANQNNLIESIEVSNGVEYIGDYAFGGCVNLSSITFNQSVKTLGNSAFAGCSSITNINMPNIETIGSECFANCTALTSVKMERLLYGGDSAFDGCEALNSCELPNLDYIGNRMFAECLSLTDFTVSNTVKNIGSTVFDGDIKIKKVIIGNGIEEFSSDPFGNCHSLEELVFVDGEKSLVFSYMVGEKKYESPFDPSDAYAPHIEAYGCFDNLNLKKVYIGRELKGVEIGYVDKYICNPFLCNNTLESVTVGSKVKNLRDNYTTRLTAGFFQGCINLKDVTFLAQQLETVSSNMFRDCTSLENIIVPNSVKRIEPYAFYGCDNLKEITIGYNTSYIGDSALDKCNALESITFYSPIAPSYRNDHNEICYFTHDQYFNVILNIPEGSKDSYTEEEPWCNFWTIEENPDLIIYFTVDNVKYQINDNRTSVTILELVSKIEELALEDNVEYHGASYSLTDIAPQAFKHWGYELKKITFPLSLKSIPSGLCDDCHKLENVIFPLELISIGEYAFRNCRNIKSVSLPDKLTSIGIGAFKNCDNLEIFDCNASISDYPAECFDGCVSIKSISLTGSINIGNSCFKNCKSLTQISIPESCISIESNAFTGCTSLTKVHFERSSNSISLGSGSINLSNYITPYPNATTIDQKRTGFRNGYYEGLFYGLPIEHLIINRDIELPMYYERTIGSSASNYETVYNDIIYYPPFYGLTNLKYVEIGANVSAICKNQIEAVVDAVPTSIEYTNFGKCDIIEVVVSNNSVAPIGGGFTQSVYENASLFLPSGGEESYKNDEYWKQFAKIEDSSYIATESIVFDTDEIIIDINESKILKPIINPEDASIKKYKWSSSVPSIVSVSEDGTITSNSRSGEAIITVLACDGTGLYACIKIVVQEGAGVKDPVKDDEFEVSVVNCKIFIRGKDESDVVNVFNIHGQLVTSSTSSSIDLHKKGMYIVKIGSNSKKVIL